MFGIVRFDMLYIYLSKYYKRALDKYVKVIMHSLFPCFLVTSTTMFLNCYFITFIENKA